MERERASLKSDPLFAPPMPERAGDEEPPGAAPEDEPPAGEPAPVPDDEPTPEPKRSAVREQLEPAIALHQDHPVYFWLAAVGILVGLVAVGAALWPETVVEDFLWTHFWGPTAADANQRGFATYGDTTVDEDYTLTSEIIYGLILAAALTSIYVHVFRKRGIDVDGSFIAALVPYIFFGPLARSLEDASVFCEIGTEVNGGCDPGLFSYAFISPFIYLVAAAAVMFHLLLADRIQKAQRETRLQVVGAVLGAQVLAYTAVYYGMRSEFTVMARPLAIAALAVLAFAVYYVAVEVKRWPHRNWMVASLGLPMALWPLLLIGQWTWGSEWVTHAKRIDGVLVAHPETPMVIPVVLGLTLLVVAVFAALGYFLRRDAPDFASFLAPLNLGLVAGHMIDGFATFTAICSNPGGLCSGASGLGVDAHGYGEKHPVSEFFLTFADGWGFPLMKLILVLLIIVLIDRSAKDGDEDPNLVGLVKLAVLVLGLGPGVRDLARVAMGV